MCILSVIFALKFLSYIFIVIPTYSYPPVRTEVEVATKWK